MSDADVSDAYWAGAARNALVVQRCEDCGALRHYPRILCDTCYSFDWSPAELEKRGTLYSWTISAHAFDPSLVDQVPYVLATVDIAPGVRVLGRLRDGVDIRQGMELDLRFETDDSGQPFPVFAAGSG